MGLLFEYSVGQRPAETPLFSIRNAKETDKIGDCALLLRKPSIPIGAGINKPPLIGLHGQTTDTVLFLLALAFEVLGLWLAHSMGGVSIVGVALVTVFFILVDVAAAVAFHRLRSGKTDWYVASAFAARQGQGGDEKERGAARTAGGRGDKRVRELQTVSREARHVRRSDLGGAVGLRVRHAVIVGDEDDDVGEWGGGVESRRDEQIGRAHV